MFKLLSLALTVTLAFGQSSNFNGGQAGWYCGILGNEDCNTHHSDPRCGTDGITYKNMCALGQAHCNNANVNQYHAGVCTTSHTTTLSPQQALHGSQIILDFQCAALSHRDCTNVYDEKICGTDGRTYPTLKHKYITKHLGFCCEYEKARCTHRSLHVAKLGDCSA